MAGGGAVSELTAAIDRVLEVDVTPLDDAELRDGLKALRTQRARLAAVETRWSRAFHRRGLRWDDGGTPPAR